MFDGCLYVEKAKALAKEIQVKKGTPDIKEHTRLYHAIAQIRHNCTNYEELLERLNEEAFDENGMDLITVCYWRGICKVNLDEVSSFDEYPCIEEGYQAIRDAADDLAEKLLEQGSGDA